MADTNFQAGTVVASSWLDDVNTAVYSELSAVSAGPNAITANGPSTLTAYPRGVIFKFMPQATSTGALTINISGLGVRNITKLGTQVCAAGDLVQGGYAYIIYDGTQFQLLNPPAGRLIGTQRFTANGTYTPTAGTTSIVVEMVGGGGGSGGSPNTGVGTVSFGGGGGGGAYSKGRFTSGFSGAAVTVGAAGAAGVLNGTGGTGGTSSLGALITAPGGGGGTPSIAAPTPISGGGGGGNLGTGGNIAQLAGQNAAITINQFSVGAYVGGTGAGSFFGSFTNGAATSSNAAGATPAAGNYGSGGGGSATGQSQGGASGGAGSAGLVIIYEYS